MFLQRSCAYLITFIALLSVNSYVLSAPSSTTHAFPDLNFATVDLCKSCHGPEGLGIADFTPMLAGQSLQYLDQQIKLYQTGRRVNAMMTPMSLKVDDAKVRQEILSYFAALPGPHITKFEQPGDQVIINDPIKRLAYQGDWSRNIPACTTCHGPSGAGIAAFPRLANQQSSYIADQLVMWQKGLRRGDENNVMGNIAKKLTAEEITGLALYFSTIK